jgi:hypothetical protein
MIGGGSGTGDKDDVGGNSRSNHCETCPTVEVLISLDGMLRSFSIVTGYGVTA